MKNIEKIGDCYPFVFPCSGIDTNIRVATTALLDAGQILVINGNQFLIKELVYIPIIKGPYESHYYCTVSWLQGMIYNRDTKRLNPRDQVKGDVYLLNSQEVAA